jgi:hypothetical protein
VTVEIAKIAQNPKNPVRANQEIGDPGKPLFLFASASGTNPRRWRSTAVSGPTGLDFSTGF